MRDRRGRYAAELPLLRDRLNLTQAEMAAKIGVSLRAYQNWELGNTYPAARNRRVIEGLYPELAVA